MIIDDADISDGAPVGVQVWCLPGPEEEVLRVAKVVDDSLKAWKSRSKSVQ